MKKILIISQNFYPELGSCSMRIKTLYELLSKDYKVNILTKQPSYGQIDLYKDHKTDDENVYRVKGVAKKSAILSYITFVWQSILFLYKSKKDYDVVIATSPPMSIMLIGLFAKKKFRAKLILDIRDLWPDSIVGVGAIKSKFVLAPLYWLERFAYKAADKITYNSKGFKNHLDKHQKKSIYIPNGFTELSLDLRTDMCKNRVRNKKEFKIIYSGNAGLAQDLNPLIKIAKAFNGNSKLVIKLYIYGRKVKETKSIIKENNLQNISVEPALPYDKIIMETSASDLAFFTLKDSKVFETVVPGKVLDYLSLGLPIFGIGKGHIKNMSEEYDNFDVFQEKDLNTMINLVEDYLLDKKKMNMESSFSNINRVKNEFNWSTNIKYLKEVIENI